MVNYLTPLDPKLSSEYLKVREIEERLLSDHEVLELPEVNASHKHKKEWNIRANTCSRFLRYLKGKNSKSILDVGCGNGWFSNKMAETIDVQITALDINEIELEQADRLFQQKNLQFTYADLFNCDLPNAPFDIIIFNSSVQYFNDINHLIKRLKTLLSDDGEIHILDSPFYKSDELEAARERTQEYYSSIGCPGMAKNYFHHEIDAIRSFHTLYRPNRLLNLVSGRSMSPFLWIMANKKMLH